MKIWTFDLGATRSAPLVGTVHGVPEQLWDAGGVWAVRCAILDMLPRLGVREHDMLVGATWATMAACAQITAAQRRPGPAMHNALMCLDRIGRRGVECRVGDRDVWPDQWIIPDPKKTGVLVCQVGSRTGHLGQAPPVEEPSAHVVAHERHPKVLAAWQASHERVRCAEALMDISWPRHWYAVEQRTGSTRVLVLGQSDPTNPQEIVQTSEPISPLHLQRTSYRVDTGQDPVEVAKTTAQALGLTGPWTVSMAKVSDPDRLAVIDVWCGWPSAFVDKDPKTLGLRAGLDTAKEGT